MSTSHLSVYFFLQAGLIIMACRLVGKLAQRLGQPQVVGEMIAGVMLGPSLLGAVLPEAQAILFPKATLDMLYVGGQVGVGMYMFLVGTEFQAAHIRSRYRSAMAVSWAGIAVPFLLAFALTAIFVVAPLAFNGRTLHEHGGFLFALTPRRGGRTPELDDKLLPLEVGLADLTELRATAEGAVRIKNGNAGMVIASDAEFGEEVWVSYQGKPLGVGIYKSGEVHPNRVFNL